MAGYFRIIRGFSPSVRYYILANAAIGFAYFGIFTVLYNLFLLRLGYSMTLIGQINGVGQLCWALLALPASLLGRKMGLRNAQVIGGSIICLGMVLFLLVELLPDSGQVAWLYATTVLIWAGAALVTVNGLPYLVGVTQPRERSHALAVNGAILSLTAVVGSLVAGLLPAQIAALTGAVADDPAPYRLTLWLAPTFFALAAFIFSRMKPGELLENKSATFPSSKAPLMIFLFFGVIIFFQTASEGAVRAFFNVYLDQNLGMSITQIGILFGLAGLLPIAGSLLMPPLVTKLGSGAAFILSGLGSAVILVLLGLVPHPLAAAFGFAVFNMIASLLAGVRGILSQEIVQPLWRTATSAILIMGMAFGWAGMALLGSALLQTLKFNGLMYLSAASFLLSISLMFCLLAQESSQPGGNCISAEQRANLSKIRLALT